MKHLWVICGLCEGFVRSTTPISPLLIDWVQQVWKINLQQKKTRYILEQNLEYQFTEKNTRINQ